jgi:hypothetical protein
MNPLEAVVMNRSLCWLIVSDDHEPEPVLEMLALCEKKLQDYLDIQRQQSKSDSYSGVIFFCHCPNILAKSDDASLRQQQINSGWDSILNWCRNRPTVTNVNFEEPLIMYPKKQAISLALANGAWKNDV